RLEGNSGARGILEEQVHDRFSAQRGEFLHLAQLRRRHIFGRIENAKGLLLTQRFCVEQVSHQASEMVTSSTPSCSRRRTAIRSPLALGRFLPTKSAPIRSSPCPRSMSAASFTTSGRP